METQRSSMSLPDEVQQQLDALPNYEQAFCRTPAMESSLHLFEVYPELESYLAKLDPEYRAQTEEELRYYHDNAARPGDIDTTIYKLTRGLYWNIALGKAAEKRSALLRQPELVAMEAKRKKLGALRDRIAEIRKQYEEPKIAETAFDATSTADTAEDESPSAITPEASSRIVQANAVLPDIRLKLRGLRSSPKGNEMEIAKLEGEERFWQGIIDNNGEETHVPLETQLKPKLQRR